MATRLPNTVYRAINAEMTPAFNRWAKKNYGMSGKRLIAKTYAVEGGGSIDEGTARRSSAGAWGRGQFIPSTCSAYIKQYGVDPWKNDRSAVRGAMIHLVRRPSVAEREVAG
jgi:membrane-bound lytic murein transglycosylase B